MSKDEDLDVIEENANGQCPRPYAVRAISVLISAYRAMFFWRPSPCRFQPSCSEYALQAVNRFGACKGSFLALRRLGRCHPWGRYGYDPVPEESSSK